MKRRLLGIVTALVLSTATVVAIAPAPDASASRIYYECRKYSWWWGWSIVHTTEWRYYTDKGYTCYCIGTLDK